MTQAYYFILWVLFPLALLSRGGRVFGSILLFVWLAHLATDSAEFWHWLARQGLNAPFPLRSYSSVLPDVIGSAALAYLTIRRAEDFRLWKFVSSGALWTSVVAHGLFWYVFLNGLGVPFEEHMWSLRVCFTMALLAVVMGNKDGIGDAIEAFGGFNTPRLDFIVHSRLPLGGLDPVSAEPAHKG